jgi:hypothetical protein
MSQVALRALGLGMAQITTAPAPKAGKPKAGKPKAGKP